MSKGISSSVMLLLATTATTITLQFFVQNALLGALCLCAWLFSAGRLLGPRVLPNATSYVQTILGAVIACVFFLILGTMAYWLMPIPGIVFSFLLVATTCTILALAQKPNADTDEKIQLPKGFWFAVLAIAVFLFLFWSIVSPIQILDAVRSLWAVLSPLTLLPIFLALLSLSFLFYKQQTQPILILLFAILFFSSISLAAILYPLGYGFDPFIHEASISHIATTGTLTPKTLYYIGQYMLELGGLHLFALPLELLNRFLAPVLATVLLTTSGFFAFKTAFQSRRPIALFSLFLLPLGAFISTTPQTIAYILIASVVLFSLPRILEKTTTPPLWVLGVLTAAVLCLHPLAGIPALWYFFFLLLHSTITKKSVRNFLTIFIALGSCISIPLVFLLQARLSGLDIAPSLSHLFDFSLLALPHFLGSQGQPIFDLFYLFIGNGILPILILSAIGIYFAIKEHAPMSVYLPALSSIVCLMNFWLLSTTLNFSFLIEYERQDYAERLLVLACLFLLPYLGIALVGVLEACKKTSPYLAMSFLVFLSLWMTANVYGAYPRHDNYARSAGFNVSATDFIAVRDIAQDAGSSDYIVLANQSVSAAALHEFGFKTYYNGDLFYYPIPTGGPLYEKYLAMAEGTPSRATMISAMELAGVDRAYFVVNAYWWDADAIIEQTKAVANDWFAVGDGDVTIFVFER